MHLFVLLQVTWIETKSENKPSKVYINLDEEDNDDDDDDVIYVKKKVTSPPPMKPYKFFINKNTNNDSRDEYYRLSRKLLDRNSGNVSPGTYNKFKAPAGITKTYRKVPANMPRWMQASKTSNLSNPRSRYLNLNGNARSTLSEVFNLDEKRSYQELIRRVASSTRPVSLSKPVDIINVAEDSASFRKTQKAQRRALDEIKLLEKGLAVDKENESTKEYDPITVASINSSDSEVEIVPSESSTSSSVRIDPVNSLRDSYKDNAVTAGDWLAKLDTKYKKMKNVTQEKLRDARRESEIISKVLFFYN